MMILLNLFTTATVARQRLLPTDEQCAQMTEFTTGGTDWITHDCMQEFTHLGADTACRGGDNTKSILRLDAAACWAECSRRGAGCAGFETGPSNYCELWVAGVDIHASFDTNVPGYNCYVRTYPHYGAIGSLGENTACRGESSSDNDASYYEVAYGLTVDECHEKCLALGVDCTGYEFGSDNRCEIWNTPIGATKNVPGYECHVNFDLRLPWEGYYTLVGDACRVNGEKHGYRTVEFQNPDDCRVACSADFSCTGYEVRTDEFKRCELYDEEIEPSDGEVPNFECYVRSAYPLPVPAPGPGIGACGCHLDSGVQSGCAMSHPTYGAVECVQSCDASPSDFSAAVQN